MNGITPRVPAMISSSVARGSPMSDRWTAGRPIPQQPRRPRSRPSPGPTGRVGRGRRARHRGRRACRVLGDGRHAVVDQCACVLAVHLVLRGAGLGEAAMYPPGPFARMVLAGVLVEAPPGALPSVLERWRPLGVDAVRVVELALAHVEGLCDRVATSHTTTHWGCVVIARY